MSALFTSLAAFLTKIFGKNLDFFADIISRKTALSLAALAIIVGMMATLYATVTALLASIAFVMPDALVIGASWIVPDNLNECITAYLSAEVAIALFRWQKEQIKLSMYIT